MTTAPRSTKEFGDYGLNVAFTSARRTYEKMETSCDFSRTRSIKPRGMSSIFFVGTLTERELYLADPYFMPYLDEKKRADSDLVQLYLELFSATTGRSLRILCAQKKRDDARPWWSNYPETLTNHVSVRAFLKLDEHNPDRHKRGFHDRYLITPEREVAITHSLNGWCEDGVTFINLPYGVYRAEAEQLWSMDFRTDAARLFAEEIR